MKTKIKDIVSVILMMLVFVYLSACSGGGGGGSGAPATSGSGNSNGGGTTPTSSTYDFSDAPAGSTIKIETKSDGSGEIFNPQNMTADESVTLYAIARDANNNFLGIVEVNWDATNSIGTLSSSTGSSITFTADQAASGAITVSYSDIATATTGTITVTPDSIDHFLVNGVPATVGSGQFNSVTVTAKDSHNNTVTNYTGTITFSSSDSNGSVALPANYSFVSGDNGVHTFTNQVKLITASSNASVTVSDNSDNAITGSQTGIVVLGNPISPTFTLYDNDEENSAYSNSVNLRATVNGSCENISKIYLSTLSNGVTASDIDSNGVSCATTAYLLSVVASSSGNQTLYLWSKNSVGIISITPTSDSIVIDTSGPSAPVTISDEGTYSNDLNLPITFTVSTDVDSGITSYETKLYSDNGCTTLVATRTANSPVTFSSSDGVANGSTYYAKVRAKNGAGSWGNYSACSDGVVVMTDLPESPAFTLYDDDTANASYSSSVNLRATITGSCVGVSKVYLTEASSNVTVADIENNGVACSTDAYTLSATAQGTGSRALYLWVKNVAGSIDSTPATDSIVVDTSAPSVPGTPEDDGIATSSTDLDFAWTASSDNESGIVNYSISLYTNNLCTTLVATNTEAGITSLFTAADGVVEGNTYYAKVRAVNGVGVNSNYSSCSNGILVDSTPPTGTITLGGGANYWTTNTSPTIALTQAGSAIEYRLCTDNLCSTVVSNGWESYTANPTAYNFNSQGSKNLYAQFRDSALNTSNIVSDSITIDTTVPSAPTSVNLQDPVSSPSSDSTPTIRIGGLEAGSLVNVYTNNTCTSSVVGSGTAVGSTLDVTLSALNAGSYTFYIEQSDSAGNVSDCSTVNVSYAYQLSFKQVVIGGRHSCGLRTDGKAYCWGLNSGYQLGTGDTTNRAIPTAVNTTDNFTILAAADSYTCGIRSTDGRILCWGENDQYGRLGTGNASHQPSPTLIASTESFVEMTLARDHACAIRTSDRRAICWGYGGQGQLGNNSFDSSMTPVLVNSSVAFTGIISRSAATCSLRNSDKFVYCWGVIGTTYYQSPTLIVSVAYKNISMSVFHMCGVRQSDNKVYCAGNNGSGQLANGSTGGDTDAWPSSFALINSALTFDSVSCGGSGNGNDGYTCAIAASGSVYCWGYGYQGQMGNGTSAGASVSNTLPVAVSSSDLFSMISSGGYNSYHSCALRNSDGNVYCWGDCSNKQIGNGCTNGYVTTPALVDSSNLQL